MQTIRIIAFYTFLSTFLVFSNGIIQLENPIILEKHNFTSPKINELSSYTPQFNALNINESMVLTPVFTPDNALYIYKYWLDQANISIDIQTQYITQFDDTKSWEEDPSPIIQSIITAKNRGVAIQVQLNEDSDSDNVTEFLLSIGVEVRWMGSDLSNSDNEYLADTHNKLILIDGTITLISSINFGENAFTNNREAGIVIQSTAVTNYFSQIFLSDWADGEIPWIKGTNTVIGLTDVQTSGYISHTTIPLVNYTGSYNVTLFANPDNADEIILPYLKSAKQSIYVSMYTISRDDFTNSLIDLKKANPSMDIQVLISNHRVNPSENVDTQTAAEALVANLIPVYNSTSDSDKVNNFYHNKYWIIDGKHIFVYSGNWSPRSVTPQKSSYTSTEANRDMGIAVHDAPSMANFIKNQVWDKDVAVADAWEIPIGIKQSSFSTADILKGEVTISGQISAIDLEGTTISYRWGENSFIQVGISNTGFSEIFDTTIIPNGITTFEVKAVTDAQTFSDKVVVNIANYVDSENWRVLITEILPNPDPEPDTEGEFIELTNSFPFNVLLDGFKIGDVNDLYEFPSDYEIAKYSSIIIARDLVGFENANGLVAEIELEFSLKNSDDYIQFLNAKGEILDIVAYGDAVAPDDSATNLVPEAGKSLQRTPLHLDTDSISDFIIDTPNPKQIVPNEPLNTEFQSEDTPWSTMTIFSVLILLPIIRWKSKLRK